MCGQFVLLAFELFISLCHDFIEDVDIDIAYHFQMEFIWPCLKFVFMLVNATAGFPRMFAMSVDKLQAAHG